MKLHFFLICYDVRDDDRRRQKLANLLLDYGHRIQFSVFEAWLNTTLLDELLRRAMPLLDPTKDSLRFYPLCRSCTRRCLCFGRDITPALPPDTDVV